MKFFNPCKKCIVKPVCEEDPRFCKVFYEYFRTIFSLRAVSLLLLVTCILLTIYCNFSGNNGTKWLVVVGALLLCAIGVTVFSITKVGKYEERDHY